MNICVRDVFEHLPVFKDVPLCFKRHKSEIIKDFRKRKGCIVTEERIEYIPKGNDLKITRMYTNSK